MGQIVKGSQLIAFEWSMVAFTFLLVLFRIYSRGINKKLRLLSNNTRRLRVSDFFVVMAWLAFISQAIMDTVLYSRGFFLPKYSSNNMIGLNDSVMLKIYFIESGTYLITMYCTKAAMLCLFHEFFPKLRIVSKNRSWIALCVVDAIVFACYVSGQVSMVAGCLPVWRNWSLNPKLFCSPSLKPIIAWYWGSHVATDLFIYLLPISVVRSMNLSHQDKVGITVVFSLGFLCILFAIGTITSSYRVSNFADQWIFTVFEQTWAITIVSLPAIRSLIVARNVKPHVCMDGTPGNSAEAAANGSWVPTYGTASYNYETESSCKGGKVMIKGQRAVAESAPTSPIPGSAPEHFRMTSCGGSVFSDCSGGNTEAICPVAAGGERDRWWRSARHALDKGRK